MYPVLIIQGFLAPTLTNYLLKNRLQRAGFTAEDVPIEGLNAGDIRDSARVVEMAVNAMLTRARTKQVDLIGISMGGLIGLHYLRKLGGDDYVRRFIAIGTPFHGTHFARLMKALTFGRAPGAEQMIPGSDFLRDLHDHDNNHKAEIYSLHTSADAFVEESAARLDKASLVKSPHGVWPIGHYTPLFLKQDFAVIKEILER
ncbi:MAG: alpha/beta fold hydrolase [Leptospiraceae bacterium]|nr:alpha/beta fold hydrolase [Leptospiraceae bacterium]